MRRRSVDKRRIVFVHPAIRPYRAHIYQALQESFSTKFYFIGFEGVNRRWTEHFGIHNYEIFSEGYCPGYRSSVSWALARRALTDDYDVWIASTLYGFTTHLAFPFVKLRKKLFVLWSEDWYWGGDAISRLATPLCRTILRGADQVIVAGSRQKEFACDNGVPAEKVRIAYNSFAPLPHVSAPAPVRSVKLPDKQRFRVLYLGRILEYKGLDWLIESYAYLETQYPGKTELVIGGTGPFESACRQLVERLGLKTVGFLGRIDPEQVEAVYKTADVFVHPCRWCPTSRVKGESWGFVINEAMSAGLPVVTTTAVGSAYDLIEHGKSGFVIAPEDRSGLTRVLDRLFQDASLRKSVGDAARTRIQSLFTPGQQAAAFVAAVRASF